MKKLALVLSVFVFFALISVLPCSANSVNALDNSFNVVASANGLLPNVVSDLAAGHYRRHWVPGHYVYRHGRRHYVNGYYRQVWVNDGGYYQGGYYHNRWVPGYYRYHHGRRHWVPGHYQRHWVPGRHHRR